MLLHIDLVEVDLWQVEQRADSATSGDRWPRELLKEIKCPTVVIHGVKDQLFPMGHTTALRDDIQRATLVVLEDCGHELLRGYGREWPKLYWRTHSRRKREWNMFVYTRLFINAKRKSLCKY